MNGTGPEGKGPQTGRALGKCHTKSSEEVFEKLGTGMGLKRKAGGGLGEGKRLKSGINVPKNK